MELGACLALIPCGLAAANEPDEEEHGPVQIAHTSTGVVVLTLGGATQQRVALSVATVEPRSYQPTVVAHGQLDRDPSTSLTLRSPVAGVLRAMPDRPWPEVGSRLETDAVLGYVEPRFTSSEWIDLHSRKLDAQADLDEMRADLDAARASFENKSRLNTENGLVSDRSMEEAQARFKSAEARVAAAEQKVDLFDSLISGRARERVSFPIRAPADGEVVDVPAQPGETVESGQVLLHTARFNTMIARVSLFVGESVESPLPEAQIALVGGNEWVSVGRPMGAAPAASDLTGGQVLLFQVRVPVERGLRPGTAVTAHIPTPGRPLDGVFLPSSAILRHGGRTWAYAKTGGDRFERRDVVLYAPVVNGWFVTSGASPGEVVVVAGAQMLLSEELRSQIEREEEAEE